MQLNIHIIYFLLCLTVVQFMVICIDFVHDECNEYVETSSCKGNYRVQTLTLTVYLFNIIFIFREKCCANCYVMHI